MNKLLNIKTIEIVISKTNPRKDFSEDSMQELINSIKEKGILQPIIVRQAKEGYELIAGERRYRAAMNLKLESIPCSVVSATDEEAIEIQIIENLQRKDVHPMEEAIALQVIASKSKISLIDLGKKIGKNGAYVAQRMHLTNLIKEFQKAFLENKMNLGMALRVSKLNPKIQKEIWTEWDLAEDDEIEISEHILKRYSQNLSSASFDITDEKLYPKAGSCLGCHNNSSCHNLLFPEDTNNGKCLLVECFMKKVELSFNIEIKKSIEDPAVILVDTGYEASETTKKLRKDGHEVLVKGYSGDTKQFDVSTETTLMTFEQWLEEDGDEDDSEKEQRSYYARYVKETTAEIEQDKKDIAAGKYLKAFVVSGDDKGKYVYVKLVEKNVKSGEKSPQGNIASETKRMNDNEKRKKQLDEEKINIALYEALDKSKSLNHDKELTVLELVSLNIILIEHLGYEQTRSFLRKAKYTNSHASPDLYNKLIKETPTVLKKNVNTLTRLLILDKFMPTKGSRPETSSKASALRSIALESNAVASKKIIAEQKAECEKREARLKERIAQLQKPKTTKK